MFCVPSTAKKEDIKLSVRKLLNIACGVVPGPAASVSPENMLEKQIRGLHPDLLNQKLCGRGVIRSLPCDFAAY